MLSSSSLSSSSTQSHLSNNPRSEDVLKTELLINLVEPSIILRGNPDEAPGTFLRGQLILNLNKPTNIKKIEMKFTGKAKTFWVSGYGSEQREYTEKHETINHQIQFATPPTVEESSQHGKFGFKNLSTKFKDRSNIISAGSHAYPFEIFIPGNLPETVKATHGSIKYKLVAEVSRSVLLPKLVKKHDLKIIRILPDYETSEGIALSNDYDSTLRYEISIPRRAYPLGQTIPVEIKLIPLTKNLKVHGLRIELLEETIYTANGTQAKVTKVVAATNDDSLAHEDLLQDQEGDIGIISYHENLCLLTSNETNCSMKTPLINISHDLKFYFTVTLPPNFSKSKLFVRCPISMVSCLEAGEFYDLPNYEENFCCCDPEYQRVARLVLGESVAEGHDCGNCENCGNCGNRILPPGYH